MVDHLRSELVVSALEMALARRRPDRGLNHSDQGCLGRYTLAACQLKERISNACALCVLVRGLVAIPSSSTTPPRTFRTAVYPGSRMR
jgi:hypothetical protein